MSPSPELSVCVFGAGSVGCYLGGLLAHGGAAVTLIGRARIGKDIAQHGLTLSHLERPEIHVPADSLVFDTEAKAVGGADFVLICVKSQDTARAAEDIAPFLAPGTLIVSFQNGVSNTDVLERVFDDSGAEASVLGGIVPFNVTSTGPGRFHCGTDGELIAQADPDPRLQQLVSAFGHAGQPLRLEADIRQVQWGKLLINLNNGLSALWGGPLKAGMAQRGYRRALAAMIEEALDITAAAGQPVKTFGRASPERTIKTLRYPNWLYAIIMQRIVKIDADARSSMLDDLEAGKSCEIDCLQGEVVSLAQDNGKAAPINLAFMDHVKAAFSAGQSPQMSGDELWEIAKAAGAG